MAETKRINDTYTIKAPTIIIDGDLQILGERTVSDVQDTTINDNTILLNSGETGAGITYGTSGIEIDRGTLTNVSFVYDDTIDKFRALDPDNVNIVGAGLAKIQVAEPDASSDAATKNYVDTASSSIVAAGVENSLQFNTSNAFDGDSNLLYDGTSLTVGNTNISTSAITVDDTNGNLELSANGTGTLYIRSVVRMENETSDPAGIAGSNQLYAKATGEGGSGIYFSNTDTTDELVSRRRAIVFGIVF
jgi:hypothetical protein